MSKSSGRPFGFTFTFYWCPDHNVPVLNPRLAYSCSSFLMLVKPTEPGDVRPAFPYDILIIREAIFREFQDWRVADLLVPSGSLVLLNKVPGYPDEADEVIVNGEVVGHRWYDPATRTWRFRPIFQGAAKMLENKVGYYAIVDLPKLTRGYEIHRTRIVQAELPPRKGMLVIVQTQDGKWQGLAKLVRSKRLYVIKAWRSVKPTYVEARSSWRDVIEVNEKVLETFEERARKFLRRLEERYGQSRRLVVSYSGGKDSLVVLDLACKYLKNFVVIFNDTSLELPDTYINVHEVENKYGIEIHWARARCDFSTIVKMLYLPSRDFRYCCKMLKLAPISQLLKKLAPTGSISIVGQRRYESSLRARLPQIAKSRWVANTLVAAPINEWTSLHVWLYIFRENLPYNKAYEKGFDRIGCWACPANELAELDLASHWYSNLREWLENVIENIRKELNLPSYWSIVGLWRWREKYPGDVRKYIERTFKETEEKLNELCNYYRENALPLSINLGEGSLRIVLKKEVDYNKLLLNIENLLHTLKLVSDMSDIDKGGNMLKVNIQNNAELLISIEQRQTIEITVGLQSFSSELVGSILRVIVRAAYCTSCGLCESWCGSSAISVERGLILVSRIRCRKCGLCNIVCPVAEYLVARSGLLKKFEEVQSRISSKQNDSGRAA